MLGVIRGLCFEDAGKRTWWESADCRLYVREELIFEILEVVVEHMRLAVAVSGAGGKQHLPGDNCPLETC